MEVQRWRDSMQLRNCPQAAHAMKQIAAAVALSVTIASVHAGGLPARPSFDCAKATTPSEHLICSDPALASGDRDVASRFAHVLGLLDAPAAIALKRDQRIYIGTRDALVEDADDSFWRDADGDVASRIASLQQERAAFLGSVSTRPANGLVGNWKNAIGEVAVVAGKHGAMSIHINGAEPRQGRWVCEFEGSADGVAANARTLQAAENDGDGAGLRLTRHGASLVVRRDDANASETYCGLNGSVEGSYFRVR